MKNKIWLTQIPLVALFASTFLISEAGSRGELHNLFLRESIFPSLRIISGLVTNLKFKVRGPTSPKNKIVIVEIDSPSLETLGRWPWHRDMTALLVDRVFQASPKAVGLDIVFSEPDKRISEELAMFLKEKGLGDWVDRFETDHVLTQVINQYRDRIILGWMTESSCQPAYAKADECPVTDPDAINSLPRGFEKFAYTHATIPENFEPTQTVMVSAPTVTVNLPEYNNAALYSGYFSAWPDPDGYIRRTNLAQIVNKTIHPSLPLEMARVGLGEDLKIELDTSGKIKNLAFEKSGRKIPVTPVGSMEVNFRGPSFSFQYVRAMDVMFSDDVQEIHISDGRRLASVNKNEMMEMLKDAYVFIGVSALGVFDMRAFPYDSNSPGVEGHANILDNLLSSDMLVPGVGQYDSWILFLLMVVGALLFAFWTERLESIPALLLFIFVIGGFGALDFKLLFNNNVNWNTSLFYVEIFSIFVFTVAVKYVMEEKNRKFIRGAFTKYVSPAVVDSILKDPAKLTVGGEKRELTILFSDIRSFTTFSEKLDPKILSQFLNEYLGLMTDIIFKHQGTLDKYIGDAVMAFWGAPLDQPHHAINCCKAAIEMQQVLAQHRQRFFQNYGVDVNIGVGINSGAVSVGNMGSDNNFAYTVLGDHVNLASRLEGLTKYYASGILTTRFTLDHIKGSGQAYPLHRVVDFVKVKGKKQAVELIQILDTPMPTEGLTLFEEARILYTKQQWDNSIEKFRQANALFRSGEADDGPCLMYIERCKEFKQNPPTADWDGSWEMTSK